MASFSIDVIGQQQLIAKLTQISASVSSTLEDATRAGASLIEIEARNNALGISNALAASISTTTTVKSPTVVVLEIGPQEEDGADIEYGSGIYADGASQKMPWVEKGSDGNFSVTPTVIAKPYLRPAFDAKQSAAVAALQEQIVRSIEGASL